jgi:hypothetical protein
VSDRAPRQREFRSDGGDKSGNTFATYEFDSFDGMTISVRTKRPQQAEWPVPTMICAVQPDARSTFAGGGSSRPRIGGEFATAAVEVRNTGATSVGPGYLWTARRTYPLLGETLPERHPLRFRADAGQRQMMRHVEPQNNETCECLSPRWAVRRFRQLVRWCG